MFRLKRKLNLTKMAKVSASCPAINEIHSENNSDICSTDTSSPQSDHSFESAGSASGVSRKERIFALKSIRRERKREKDQQKKIQSNNISMDDFLSKQTEFKIWLKEEKSKQAKDITSPKLKTYFKTFIKHWNRKKLNQKYYRGTDIVDTPPPSSSRQGFIFTDDSCSNTTLFPQTINLSMEGTDSLNSPFSTFGKSPLGLPIAKKRVHGTPVNSTKLQPLREDDIGKENRQENIQDETDKTSKTQEMLSVDSNSTSLHSAESNLYKVSVLSWTSKGELATDCKSPVTRPRRPKPVPPLRFPTLSEPAIADQDQSVPYKEVQDSIPVRKINQSKHLMPNEYSDPGYVDPDSLFTEQIKYVSMDSNPNKESQKVMQSPPAIYAVPVKKKKMAANEVNSYISMNSSPSPPPIPLKRKSPLESWPYDNSLMGTNVPAPCYSMNQDLSLQQSRNDDLHTCNLQASDADRVMNNEQMQSELPAPKSYMSRQAQLNVMPGNPETPPPQLVLIAESLRHYPTRGLPTDINSQPSHSNNSKPNCNKYSVKTDQASHVNRPDSVINEQVQVQLPTPKSYMSKQAHLKVMPINPDTPPPQLVSMSENLSVDSNHISSAKHSVPFTSFQPLRYETTFSTNDTDSPIKTPCSVTPADIPLTKSLETGYKANIISTLSYEQANSKMKEDFEMKGLPITDGRSFNSCNKTSPATSFGSSKQTIRDADRNKSDRILTGASDTEGSDVSEIQSSTSSQTKNELQETDIDELDSDEEDVNQHGCSSTDTGQGVIETNLDEVFEKITHQHKTKSTEWLVNTSGETTV